MEKAIVLIAVLALTACQTPQGGFCAVSSPIRLSQASIDALSDQEVADLLARNLLGQKLCGWKP